MDKLRLSNTKISIWQSCHKKYEWCYVHNLMPKAKAEPLQVGDVVHKLHHLWVLGKLTPSTIETLNDWVVKLYPEDTEEQALEVAAQAANLMKGYLNKYAEDDPLKFIPGETLIEVEFDNYILNGRVDCWVRPADGRLWRVEHKTASKMDSHYLQGLKGGLQGAIYDYLTEQTFKEKVSGTIYNLLIKTQIPQYLRAYAMCDRSAIDRMLKTVEGVYKEIMRGDYYPSSRCYGFNRECEYKMLCDNDNPRVREAFYQERKEVSPNDKTKTDEGGS